MLGRTPTHILRLVLWTVASSLTLLVNVLTVNACPVLLPLVRPQMHGVRMINGLQFLVPRCVLNVVVLVGLSVPECPLHGECGKNVNVALFLLRESLSSVPYLLVADRRDLTHSLTTLNLLRLICRLRHCHYTAGGTECCLYN